MTDTPIYDQIRQELEAAGMRTERPSARRSRAEGESPEGVSVWSLVNQNRTGRRR